MTLVKSRYPSNWPELTRRLKEARGRCEWCEAEQGATKFNVHGEAYQVILTTAHAGVPKPDGLPGDKRDTMDCREENLRVYCAACHLQFDALDHRQARHENWLRKRRETALQAGQQPLFKEIEEVFLPPKDSVMVVRTTRNTSRHHPY